MFIVKRIPIQPIKFINFKTKAIIPKYMAGKQQTIGRFFGGSAAPVVKSSPTKHKISPPSSPALKKQKLGDDEKENAKAKPLTTNLEEIIVKPVENKNEEAQTNPAPPSSSSKIPYSSLTDVMEKIENEPGRLKMIEIISQYFLEILNNHKDIMKLIKIVYLFINRLGPDYEPDLELGLGETLLVKAISECYGRSPSKVKEELKKLGDLGLVAQKSRSRQSTMFKPVSLDIDTVFDNLTKIAKSTGKDSQSRKIGIINKMLNSCDAKSFEAKFLIRSLEGKLRIGLADKTVLTGLAQALLLHENEKNGNGNKRVNPTEIEKAVDIFKEAFTVLPNYQILIEKAYEHGILNLLDHCHITPGIPLKPMLAKPTKSMGEVLDRFQDEKFTCEYKYDGERAQVHLLPDGTVRIYSRNSENMSERYPDLITVIKEFSKTQEHTSMILDCEAVAWDRINEKILPFQVLSTRKRKDVEEKDIKVHICLFAFDLLYYNDQSLITKPLNERREIMIKHLKPLEGKFQFATAKDSTSLEVLQQFLDQSIRDSCEGLMVKMLEGTESYYEPSKRSRNWLKLKKDYLDGVGDSLDLVVIGAYNGKGKRTGAYGGFLLASYNQDTGDLETTCKIGTGFSDEDLANLYQKLHPTEVSNPKSNIVYDKNNANAKPDVWFDPSMLFEILTADLSLSPIYKAAHQQYGKGISLRFPRFIRVRDDKGVEDATSSTEVAEFYERQQHVSGG
ncbi:cdc17 [Candida pseudojiufengensis]|uniref:cdc17 n=1 Tax=Candida pseudojiufengensis TaxID=497109 RepID=UPI002225420D|nr:cdc17 [Candida pseudojiufengensis]KAI5959604.1 cdc17 [Candida pseudojiufengensis]